MNVFKIIEECDIKTDRVRYLRTKVSGYIICILWRDYKKTPKYKSPDYSFYNYLSNNGIDSVYIQVQELSNKIP